MTIGWNEENIGKKENHSAALKWTQQKETPRQSPKGISIVYPK
jgi:hypothetical protein